MTLLLKLSLFFLLLSSTNFAGAQDWKIEGKSIPELKAVKLKNEKIPSYTRLSLNLFQKNNTLKSFEETKVFLHPVQPKTWKYEELAFFCRLEVKMEKAAKFPIKFRLGEVQYVEKMEGKYD